jgi:hypothetical protein
MNQEQKNKAQRFEKLAVWSEKLETRNTWFLKRLAPPERSHIASTVGKIAWGHLRNWLGPTHCRLKVVKE